MQTGTPLILVVQQDQEVTSPAANPMPGSLSRVAIATDVPFQVLFCWILSCANWRWVRKQRRAQATQARSRQTWKAATGSPASCLGCKEPGVGFAPSPPLLSPRTASHGPFCTLTKSAGFALPSPDSSVPHSPLSASCFEFPHDIYVPCCFLGHPAVLREVR